MSGSNTRLRETDLPRNTGPLLRLLREGSRRSFWVFFRHAFGAYYYCRSRPENDWVEEEHHRACNYYDKILRWWLRNRAKLDGRYILLFIMPREGGKSTMFTEAGSLWAHLQAPNLSIGIGSYSDDKAQGFLQVPKTVMEGNSESGLFTDLYGTWTGPTWSDTELVHSWRTMREIREPSYETCSVKSGATGSRYDLYFLDDPIPDRSSKEYSTQLDTDVQMAVSHVRKAWPVLKRNALFVICLTRKADHDVAAYAMKRFRVREFAETGCKPRGFEYNDTIDAEKGRTFVYFLSGRRPDGSPTLPKTWSDSAMKEYEARDPVNFASEVMNMPAEGAHVPLKEDQVERMWVPRKDIPRALRYTIHCDTAFKEDNPGSGDLNVIGLAGHSKDGTGDVYALRALVSQLWSSDDFYEHLVSLVQEMAARRQFIWCITDEKERGGKAGLFERVMLSHFKKVGLPMPRLIQFNRKASKGIRITSAMDYWLQGKMHLVEGGENLDQLSSQMLRFRFTEHEDVADAFADAFHPEVYWTERGSTGVPDRAESRPSMNIPIHMMRGEEKVWYARGRADQERRSALKPAAPWWHRERDARGRG